MPGREFMRLRVGLDEPDVAQPGLGKALVRLGQHRGGNIGAQDLAALADRLGERHGEGASAAADLEHPLAGRDPRARQQQIIHRPYPPLDEALEPDPARAGNRIPIFLLRRIRYGVRHLPLARHQRSSRFVDPTSRLLSHLRCHSAMRSAGLAVNQREVDDVDPTENAVDDGPQ